jgi:hypothetical protein
MTPNELKEGMVFFFCGYSNPKYPVPEIETYVYIGKNVPKNKQTTEQNEYVFEEPRKYFEKELLDGLSEDEKTNYVPPEEPYRIIVPESSLNTLYDIDGLIRFLLESKKEPGAKDIFE